MIIDVKEWLFSKKIDLSKWFSEEVWVALREPDTIEKTKLAERKEVLNTSDFLAYFKDILPVLIIDHNLYDKNNAQLDVKDVADIIFKKQEITADFIEQFFKWAFEPFRPAGQAADKQSL